VTPEELQALGDLLDQKLDGLKDEVMNRFEESDALVYRVEGEQLRMRADFLDLRNEIRVLSARLQRHIDKHSEAA